MILLRLTLPERPSGIIYAGQPISLQIDYESRTDRIQMLSASLSLQGRLRFRSNQVLATAELSAFLQQTFTMSDGLGQFFFMLGIPDLLESDMNWRGFIPKQAPPSYSSPFGVYRLDYVISVKVDLLDKQKHRLFSRVAELPIKVLGDAGNYKNGRFEFSLKPWPSIPQQLGLVDDDDNEDSELVSFALLKSKLKEKRNRIHTAATFNSDDDDGEARIIALHNDSPPFKISMRVDQNRILGSLELKHRAVLQGGVVIGSILFTESVESVSLLLEAEETVNKEFTLNKSTLRRKRTFRQQNHSTRNHDRLDFLFPVPHDMQPSISTEISSLQWTIKAQFYLNETEGIQECIIPIFVLPTSRCLFKDFECIANVKYPIE